MEIKIKIHHEEDGGFSVKRMVGKHWKHWLPTPSFDPRGDEYYEYFKTMKAAEKAARAEKKRLEEKMSPDVVMTI